MRLAIGCYEADDGLKQGLRAPLAIDVHDVAGRAPESNGAQVLFSGARVAGSELARAVVLPCPASSFEARRSRPKIVHVEAFEAQAASALGSAG